MTSAIIFDLDGTLLDTLQDLHAAVNHALRRHGMAGRSIDEVRQFVGDGVQRLMQRAVPAGTGAELFAAVFDDFKDYYSRHSLDHTLPYDGIMDALAELHAQGYGMAIVSNKLESATEALRRHFFDRYIGTAVGDAPGRRRKPAPDGVLEAMARLGATADGCVYVGDSDVDFRTANNAGIPCISVLWGFRSRDLLASLGATTFCNHPSELPDIISHATGQQPRTTANSR